MATGKVRIFELAKELGLSSKELIGLFERLGLDAKNQLSVVEDSIADLVRGVLGGAKKPATAPKGAAPKAVAVDAAPAPKAKPPVAARPTATAADEPPVPTLRPVTNAPK
ncbi:MAG: translation initiation factor IF-2 N-terminal domain-containing protein, partial [Candidatus Dormibacteria bacterium]